jgi:hypothetical protein
MCDSFPKDDADERSFPVEIVVAQGQKVGPISETGAIVRTSSNRDALLKRLALSVLSRVTKPVRSWKVPVTGTMKSLEIEPVMTEMQEKRDALSKRLDGLLVDAANAIPSQAGQWISKHVESRIADLPEKVTELGIEKVRLLKAQMKALIANLPEITTQEMVNRNSWPHHQTQIDGEAAQDYLNGLLRAVVSHIGSILNSFDLISENGGRAPSWRPQGTDGFRYTTGMEGVSSQAAAQYLQFYRQFVSISDALAKQKTAYTKQKAIEMWEQA